MCSGCGGGKSQVRVSNMVRKAAKKVPMESVIVAKSANPELKIPLIYYGGGMVKKTWEAGCSSCGGGNRMAMLTSETIMFASEDAPYGMFKLFVQAGHVYHVTEKQAEHMLKMTFVNQAGQTVNKFKRKED